MKKKRWNPIRGSGWQKIFLIMRITVFFFLAGLLHLSASVYSQQTNLEVKAENKSIIEILKMIEEQSDFHFLYRSDNLKGILVEDIDFQDAKLEEILDKVLVPHGFTYEIDDRTVVIKKSLPVQNQNFQQQAQKKEITGTVKDSKGIPLPGVTVLVKGTTTGTITNAEGKFTLSVSADTKTLVFSFVGMQSQEVAITGQTAVNIEMAEVITEVGEVVVVGYGVQKKESVVGSIVTTNAQALARTGSPANLGMALTGQLAGVTTIQSTGEPGNDDPRILIRAQGTWNNAQPLILVDGVERKMNDLDISEVESISVLKDASATAVFGVKGSEGVILITTKRGKIGKPKLTVEANFTLKELSKTPQKFDSYDDYLLANKAIERELPNSEVNWGRIMPMSKVNLFRNSPGFNRNSYIPDANGGYTPYKYSEVFPNVDWRKAILKPFSVSNRVNVNISGGTDFTKYFGSISYTHDGDILKSGEPNGRPYRSQWAYDRFNFRTNLDFNLTKTTVFSVNLSGYVGIKMESYMPNSNVPVWGSLYFASPSLMIPRWSDGYWGSTTVLQTSNSLEVLNNLGLEKIIRTQVSSDFALKQQLDFITKGLSATASLSYDTRFYTNGGVYDYGYGSYNRYVDPNIINMKPGQTYLDYTYGSNTSAGINDFDFVGQPALFLGETYGNAYTALTAPYRRLYYQGKIDWTRKFNKHDIAVTGVFDREEYANGSEYPRFREDWIGRVTYNFGGRYFLEGNGAYNGSEKFAKKNRFGFFPSIGASWMISNEKWMKMDWLDKLKVRYTLGKVGDDNFGNRWAYQTNWATGDKTLFGTPVNSSSPYTQYYQSTIGNPNLKWEVSQKQNFGFEVAVFKNLINVNVDVYTDDRSGIFMSGSQRNVSLYWGASPVSANLGKTHTQGYEVELKFQKAFGKVNLWMNTAFTHAKDKILYMEDPIGLPDYQKKAGFQISQTKSGIQAGFMNNWDDVYLMPPAATNKAYYQPGDLRIVDFNGDGVFDSYDSAPYGYPLRPQNTYNYFLGADWKGFSVMVQFYGVNNVTRQMSVGMPFDDGTFSRVYTATSDQWTPQNLNATWKALRITNTTTDGTLYMVDGSYFRLKTAEIAYSFNNTPWLKRLGIGSMRVFLNGNNLWVKTKMWDDREENTVGYLNDSSTYPAMKRFNLGLTINF